jgi:DNA-binding MarR family transcriptional regulator
MLARRRQLRAPAQYGTAAALIAVLGLTACRTARGTADARSYAVHPTPEGRRAIAQLVQREVPGARAIVDEDAVSDDGVRVIEPSQLRRSPQLDAGRTERFHLVKTGDRCTLIHDRTDRRYELSGSACAPR